MSQYRFYLVEIIMDIENTTTAKNSLSDIVNGNYKREKDISNLYVLDSCIHQEYGLLGTVIEYLGELWIKTINGGFLYWGPKEGNEEYMGSEVYESKMNEKD